MNVCSSLSTCSYTGLNFLADQSIFFSTSVFLSSQKTSTKWPLIFSVVARAISLPVYFMNEDVQENCPNPVSVVSYIGLNGMLGAYTSKMASKYVSAISGADKFISYAASNFFQFLNAYLFKEKESNNEMKYICDFSWKEKNVTYEKYYNYNNVTGNGFISNYGYGNALILNVITNELANAALLFLPALQMHPSWRNSAAPMKGYFFASAILAANKILRLSLDSESKFNIGLKALNSPLRIPVYTSLVLSKLMVGPAIAGQTVENRFEGIFLTLFMLELMTAVSLPKECARLM